MPFGMWAKNKNTSKETARLVDSEGDSGGAGGCTLEPARQLVFHVQLAHGSATGRVQGFASNLELYQQIAGVFGLGVSEILYCTINTPKVDMEKLLGAQLGLEDFIFAHVKGTQKEVKIYKSEDSLGLTITDNGSGGAFIKRIKEGSLIDAVKTICVGDYIEFINGESTAGWRHYDVAKKLRQLKKEENFTLKLVEPRKAFEVEPRSKTLKVSGGGRGTLRLRSKGPATVEEMPSEVTAKAIGKIDDLLELYMGIRDNELATTMFEAGNGKGNPEEFAVEINTILEEFEFPEEFIFDVWGAISDAKQGRL